MLLATDDTCLDCHTHTETIGELYMVTHPIWESTGVPGWGGMLCIGCLEQRIGRQLNATDFPQRGLNTWTHQPGNGRAMARSDRLLDRMGRQ